MNIQNREPLPLFVALSEQRSEFLEILYMRFGRSALHENLSRYTIRPVVHSLFQESRQLIKTLLSVSKLFFNRPIYIYNRGKCEKRLLFSSLIVHHCEQLEKLFSELIELNCLNTLIGHQMSENNSDDHDVDLALCKILGFNQVDENPLGYAAQEILKENLYHAVSAIHGHLKQLLVQMQSNTETDSQASHNSEIILELLNNECNRLKDSPKIIGHSLSSQETSRLTLLMSLSKITEHVKNLNTTLNIDLRAFGSAKLIQQPPLPEDIKRRLMFHLVSRSISITDARTAVENVSTYCIEKKIDPSEIIDAEYHKIHPKLTIDSLEILKKYATPTTTSKVHLEEKKRTLEKSTLLEKLLKKAAPMAGIVTTLGLYLMMNTGCGVKLPPKSSILDRRPLLPFEELNADGQVQTTDDPAKVPEKKPLSQEQK